MRKNLLGRIRKGEPFTFGELLLLTWQLSVPAIMAKITTVMMQYIDASMVGMIGAGAAASIAIDAKASVQDVDYATLRARLLADGQVIERKRK